MKRFLKVGEASSKIVWQPGARQVEMTAVAAIRGSFADRMVPKKEPKLAPETPIFCPSISGRRSNQSTTAGPVSIQFCIETKTPRSGLWYQ
jgi:hypothetical protein